MLSNISFLAKRSITIEIVKNFHYNNNICKTTNVLSTKPLNIKRNFSPETVKRMPAQVYLTRSDYPRLAVERLSKE